VGFSTYSGTVTATTEWDEPAQHKRVRPGLPGSYEAFFHETGTPNFMVRTDTEELSTARLQRAIGVIYRPDTERQSHYFEAKLDRQFDWMIHFDRTRAVEPLEKGTTWHPGPNEDVPEAYPTGL
jgi:erythromycin esterase-like protein